VNKKTDSIIRYYQQRAPEYEQIYYRDIPIKRRELNEEGQRLRQLAAGKSVLDLACGTGYWTQTISRTARTVVASDISAEMILEARLKKYSCPTHFVRADLYGLPFAAGSFDLISLGFWFSHEPRQNYQAFFDIIRPLLRPDGNIWMIDNNPPAEGPKYRSVGTDEHGNNYRQRYLNSGKEFIILKNYFSERRLRDILQPHFAINSLVFGKCYWSVVLGGKPGQENP
jgi:ubiquinone/menaquinone biosynthesis C-methylase UbiE